MSMDNSDQHLMEDSEEIDYDFLHNYNGGIFIQVNLIKPVPHFSE